MCTSAPATFSWRRSRPGRPVPPTVAGLDYAAVRAALATVFGDPPAAEPAGAARWPTPRLRRAIAQAAMQALVNARLVDRRDLWHALLTDPESDARPVLDHLGLDPGQLLKLLA
jgi:hypothetical protein